VGYGILIVPPNFYWQRALEARYPGFPTRAEFSNAFSIRSLKSIFSPRAWLSLCSRAPQEDSLPSHKEKEKHVRWAPRKQPSGLRSFVMKFFFDQTAASIVNLVLFVVIINLLKGESLKKSWELVVLVRCSAIEQDIGDYTYANSSVGFPASYECAFEISAYCFGLNVHRHSCRSTSGLWKCMWGHLGGVFELICWCLGFCLSASLCCLSVCIIIFGKELVL
jgi:hypothetical protein